MGAHIYTAHTKNIAASFQYMRIRVRKVKGVLRYS
jgi:hypothetical protein